MQLDLYYNGFCNSVLWQLFHYVPLNIDSFQKMSEHRAMQMQWQAYQVSAALQGRRGRGRAKRCTYGLGWPGSNTAAYAQDRAVQCETNAASCQV